MMIIPYNQSCYARAAYEVKKRAPYMLTKFNDSDARKAGQLRGLVIEQHVTHWFKYRYSDHFEEPDNYNQWTEVCSHDFKIKFNFESLYIDVSGPKKDGTYGSYSLKPKKGVDAHILCRPIGFISWDMVDFSKGFIIDGVVDQKDYKTLIEKGKIMDINIWLKKIGL